MHSEITGYDEASIHSLMGKVGFLLSGSLLPNLSDNFVTKQTLNSRRNDAFYDTVVSDRKGLACYH